MHFFHSAKRLTFLYFSIVAGAIIAIHASVLEFTTEDLEYIYAQNKLTRISTYAHQLFSEQTTDVKAITEISTQGKTDFDTNIKVYTDLNNLPENFPNPSKLRYDDSTEFTFNNGEIAFFLMKTKLPVHNQVQDVIIEMDHSLYELSEEQLFASLYKQISISFVLLMISLLVVLKIADRLTRPISLFAKSLANKAPDDLRPIELPKGSHTTELIGMVNTFNAYQERIQSLLKRERSFNRYTSHELRTPLTVIKGAITLLEASNDRAFVDKQCRRLSKASNEMSEFVETLLSLSKATDENTLEMRAISKAEFETIISNHIHMLAGKAVITDIQMNEEPQVNIPEAAFHILMGNLLRNAFAHIEQGSVIIEVNKKKISVIDTGSGLGESKNPEGFGLGLLLVKDICHRYHYRFELINNSNGGCSGHIYLTTP